MMEIGKHFRGRSLLTLNDLTNEEMIELLDLADTLKARRAKGLRGDALHRKHIALVFEKSSTRTRNAAAIAAADEGGHSEFLATGSIHLGSKESVADTARVLGRLFDGIMFRGYQQRTVELLAGHGGVPVWNGLTDLSHPTQILADLMTVRENLGELKGLKLVYVGDGRNNVVNSLMVGCAKAGMHVVNCTPEALMPKQSLVEAARTVAEDTGGSVSVTDDPIAAAKGANVIYTDVWVSMGEEAQREARVKLLQPYQVNMQLMEATGNLGGELIFLHCLPAFHDHETDLTRESGALEVTDDVFEAPFSMVFDEAENRMHTIKALFVSALAD